MKIQLPEWFKLVKGEIESDDDEPIDMMLCDSIGRNEAGGGISSGMFAQALSGIPGKKPMNLLINTLGGRIDDGVAMHSMINARGNVRTVVIGFAASMGSVLAQAGATRMMLPGTTMMIHNPRMDAGDIDEDDADKAKNLLAKMKNNLVDLYHNRTGLGKKKISEMMTDETFMSPQEAKQLGFCDEIGEGSPGWNRLERPENSHVFRAVFRGMHIGAPSKATVPANESQQTKPQNNEKKIMKTLLVALAGLKLIPTADMTDEAAIVTSLQTGFSGLKVDDLRNENTQLKIDLKTFTDAQKTRIEGKVTKAITDKLIKEDRKTFLTDLGTACEADLDNYLADIIEARGTQTQNNGGSQGAQRRGAPPVNTAKVGEEDSNDSKLLDLQEKMKTANSSEKVVLARQMRELRGRKDLFAKTESKRQ